MRAETPRLNASLVSTNSKSGRKFHGFTAKLVDATSCVSSVTYAYYNTNLTKKEEFFDEVEDV